MKKCIKLAHCDALHIKIHKGQKIVDYLLLIVEELAKWKACVIGNSYHYSTVEFEALLWSSQPQNNTLNTAKIFGPLKT